MTSRLSVRLVETSDFENLVDYFLKADHAFLLAMGVDISKLPKREDWLDILHENHAEINERKQFFYMIWQVDGKAVGHSNINKIKFGEEAYMHLHMWDQQTRKKGLGVQFVRMTLPYYFETFRLKRLFCEPLSTNPAPNKALEKIGFEFIESYETVPGWINSYQKVNRWCLTKDKLKLTGKKEK